ncbi:hypothetical protein [Streptomyces tibetensis]|uniref:Uncharacterized protein n=1 Tax=Streptomyces tibetensis TaxID=2382123 RepID=A0ABW6N7K4_9ACTN
MKFVMVPGGWQGGWAFDSVATELRRDGHHVEAVTLSGLESDGPVDVARPPGRHGQPGHLDAIGFIGTATLIRTLSCRRPHPSAMTTAEATPAS